MQGPVDEYCIEQGQVLAGVHTVRREPVQLRLHVAQSPERFRHFDIGDPRLVRSLCLRFHQALRGRRVGLVGAEEDDPDPVPAGEIREVPDGVA